MPTHKEFMAEFESKLPKFLQENSQTFYEDILSRIVLALQEGYGVELRGHFSMKAKQNKARNTIIFRDLLQNKHT